MILFIAFLSYALLNAKVLMEGLDVGNLAPEIILSNPLEKTLALSSIREEVFLVDFV